MLHPTMTPAWLLGAKRTWQLALLDCTWVPRHVLVQLDAQACCHLPNVQRGHCGKQLLASNLIAALAPVKAINDISGRLLQRNLIWSNASSPEGCTQLCTQRCCEPGGARWPSASPEYRQSPAHTACVSCRRPGCAARAGCILPASQVRTKSLGVTCNKRLAHLAAGQGAQHNMTSIAPSLPKRLNQKNSPAVG